MYGLNYTPTNSLILLTSSKKGLSPLQPGKDGGAGRPVVFFGQSL